MSNFLKKLQPDSLADKAADMIRRAIFEGHIKPEERLTIEHIAAQLGISRTPVREALKALETDGIIRILPNRGAIVQSFTRPELADRYTVRAALEGLAGELACRNDGRKVAALLAANNDKLGESLRHIESEDLHAIGELVALNSEFHDTILAASGSATIARMHGTLRMPVAYRVYNWRSAERRRASHDFHTRIVEAFQQDDATEVRRLLEAHILEARDFLVADQ
jgi:GntR family transcriptional regulator, vanillate catabolism transcriptional regulator